MKPEFRKFYNNVVYLLEQIKNHSKDNLNDLEDVKK